MGRQWSNGNYHTPHVMNSGYTRPRAAGTISDQDVRDAVALVRHIPEWVKLVAEGMYSTPRVIYAITNMNQRGDGIRSEFILNCKTVRQAHDDNNLTNCMGSGSFGESSR